MKSRDHLVGKIELCQSPSLFFARSVAWIPQVQKLLMKALSKPAEDRTATQGDVMSHSLELECHPAIQHDTAQCSTELEHKQGP